MKLRLNFFSNESTWLTYYLLLAYFENRREIIIRLYKRASMRLFVVAHVFSCDLTTPRTFQFCLTWNTRWHHVHFQSGIKWRSFYFHVFKRYFNVNHLPTQMWSSSLLSWQSLFPSQTIFELMHLPFVQINLKGHVAHVLSSSSVPSRQSETPSHAQSWEIHCPLPHRKSSCSHLEPLNWKIFSGIVMQKKKKRTEILYH